MANVTLFAPTGANQVSGPGGPYVVAADGTISVPTSLVGALLQAGCRFASNRADTAYFQCPAAADLVSIVAATIPVSGTPYTIAAQPDLPRKLAVRCVQSGAVASLVLNLVGTDGRGNAVTESVNVAGASSATFNTVNAYSHLTSATPVGTVTNVTTLGIGVAADLALPVSPAFVDLVVYKASVATAGTAAVMADEAVGTVDAVAGTIATTSAPNAVKCMQVWFAWTATS
jgi:hypothetical protein